MRCQSGGSSSAAKPISTGRAQPVTARWELTVLPVDGSPELAGVLWAPVHRLPLRATVFPRRYETAPQRS